LKPSSDKTPSVDAQDGMSKEDLIKLNIEKMKKRGAPKAPKTHTNR